MTLEKRYELQKSSGIRFRLFISFIFQWVIPLLTFIYFHVKMKPSVSLIMLSIVFGVIIFWFKKTYTKMVDRKKEEDVYDKYKGDFVPYRSIRVALFFDIIDMFIWLSLLALLLFIKIDFSDIITTVSIILASKTIGKIIRFKATITAHI
jgi:hypothetical protein